MFSHTIVCFGSEIGFGQGATFEAAKREAEEDAGSSAWYPRNDWGYISVAPSGLTITYNV
jgi:hypothetical protein